MKQNWQKAVLPHVYAILIFLGLAFLFCSPVMEGLEIRQSDTVQWQAMSQEARAYKDSTGINPLWTNAMFGGMPTYQIFMAQENYTYMLHLVLTLGLPKPVNFFFLAMVGFYILLSVLGFRHWVNVIGAIAFGFASYTPNLIAAGHDTKMFTIAYMAPMLAGIIMTYRGKYLIGGVVTCITLALMTTSGHYQMLYYMLLVCLLIGITYLVHAARTKQLPNVLKASVVLLVAGAFSILPSSVNIWTTSEYAKYTMRGGHSELTPEAGKEGDKSAGGLDKSYAFSWSQGVGETFTIFAPNLYGGPSQGPLPSESHLYKALTGSLGVPANQAEQMTANAPRYWGPQPMVGGGIYWGVAMLFLFVLALFIVKDFNKYWIVAASVLGVFLAWGDHFAAFNYLLFDYLPMYNKFRAPAQALVIPQLLVPLLGCWALNDVVTGKVDKTELLKKLKYAFYIVGGMCALMILGSFGFLDFTSAKDAAVNYYQQVTGNNQQVVDTLMKALREDRASLLRVDALRSLAIVAVAFALIWALLQQKIKPGVFFAAMLVLVTFDQVPVAYRYLNKDNYVTPRDYSNTFAPSEVDVAINQDKDPYYRVFNTVNFQDALSSYHHKSVGGYSPVKLALYQDLIDHQISKGNPHVLNMLNAKYIIFADQQQNRLTYQQNPGALGNAWFIDSLVWAKNADVEMKTLDSLPTGHAAVIDERFRPVLKDFVPAKDSAAHITLTKYGLNELNYRSSNSKAGLAVFSDVYYPAGWNVYIDGKQDEIVRVNYLLRGVKIPAGDHTIEMKFEPRSYRVGNTISRWSSILMLLLLAAALGYEVWRRNKATA